MILALPEDETRAETDGAVLESCVDTGEKHSSFGVMDSCEPSVTVESKSNSISLWKPMLTPPEPIVAAPLALLNRGDNDSNSPWTPPDPDVVTTDVVVVGDDTVM